MTGAPARIALHTARITLDARDGKLPARHHLLAWGDNPSTKGNIRVGQSTLVLPENQHREGFDRIAIDFEHNTLEGSPEYNRTQEPRPIAGTARPVIRAEGGLDLEDIRWTPEGEKNIQHYEDLSPVVRLNARGEVDFIHSVALTRNGAVHDLNLTYCSSQPSTSTPVMPDPTVDLTPINAALTALTARLDALEKREIPKPDLTPLSARIEALEKNTDAARTAAETKERADLVAQATKEGKVIPLSAELIAQTPLVVLRSMVEKTPSTIPLSARGTQPKADGKTSELKGRDKTVAAFNAQFNS